MISSMRVLGRYASINVRKVLWTLDEIGCPYQFEAWEGTPTPLRMDELAQLNPNAQFPVLVDAEGPLWESNTICRYLAAKAGRHDLLPAAPRARAEVEHWMDWQATDLNGAWRYAFLALQRHAPGYTDLATIQTSISRWNEKISILELHLERSGDFLTKPGFTLADIVLGLSVHRWLKTPIQRPDLPHVMAYYRCLNDRTHFRTHANEELV
jgi:glutathione S-transferase